MDKQYIKGRDFLLFTSQGGELTALGASTDCLLNLSHSPIATVSPDGWKWSGAVRGKLTWGVTATVYQQFSTPEGGTFDPLDFFDNLSTPLLAVFSTITSSELPRPIGGYVPDLRRARAGYVLPVSYEDSAPLDALATTSLAFQGVGPLLHKGAELRAFLKLHPHGPNWEDLDRWREGEPWHDTNP